VELEAEYKSIGLENERSLHASLKNWYAIPGDRLEVKVDNYIIDLVRNDILIEIQTKNFSAMGKKLRNLVLNHRVRLIHPIAITKWIIKLESNGETIISRRKSPKLGSVYNLFDELIRIPDLMNNDNFSIELIMIIEEEIRIDDGKGSWRRKGISIIDRRLLEVVKKVKLIDKDDFRMFIPEDIVKPFSNRTLSIAVGVPINKIRKTTYCLKKMNLIKEVGKKGNELLFELI
jgi:hypothetical protein